VVTYYYSLLMVGDVFTKINSSQKTLSRVVPNRMPVYTSSPLTSKAVQSPEFVARGIEKQTAGREVDLLGFPHAKQSAYDEYVSNLSAFLFATSVNKTVACNAAFFDPKLDASFYVPIPLPSVVTSPLEPVRNEDERTRFQESLKRESKIVRYVNQQNYLLERPTISEIRSLPRNVNANTPSPPNATSLLGFKQFLQTVKVLSLFLATHSYPAFQSPEAFDSLFADDSFIAIKKTYGVNKSMRYDPDEAKFGAEDKETYNSWEWLEGDKTLATWKTKLASKESVVVAKPAPLRPEINYGPPHEIPSLPGILFPYFHGLLEPSKTDLIRVVRRFFLPSFGATKEKLMENFNEWKRGVNTWYRTDEGMILSHIFLLIELALECQARLFLIIAQGRYLGAVIQGYHFTVLKDGVPVEHESTTALRASAFALDDHSKALEEICEKLSLLEVVDSGIEMQSEINPRSIKCGRQLHKEILRRKIPSQDEIQELEELMGKVHFEERYYPMAIDKIELIWSRLSKQERLEPEAPMYIPPGHLWDTSIEYDILSAFGPLAPSFLDARGTEYSIPEGATAADPLSQRDANGERPLDFILVAGKKLPTAVGDLKNVVSKRRIRQNPVERASGYRTLKFSGSARDRIWTLMKELPYEVKVTGKRNRGQEEESSAGPSSKKSKGKSMEEVAFSLDDLF